MEPIKSELSGIQTYYREEISATIYQLSLKKFPKRSSYQSRRRRGKAAKYSFNDNFGIL